MQFSGRLKKMQRTMEQKMKALAQFKCPKCGRKNYKGQRIVDDMGAGYRCKYADCDYEKWTSF